MNTTAASRFLEITGGIALSDRVCEILAERAGANEIPIGATAIGVQVEDSPTNNFRNRSGPVRRRAFAMVAAVAALAGIVAVGVALSAGVEAWYVALLVLPAAGSLVMSAL